MTSERRRGVLRASGKAVWTWPSVVAVDAGVMQIQLSEGWVWHRSWDVRASTAANGERGRVGECSEMLREGDLVKLEEEICWASRHKGTAHAVAGNGFVMLVVISCGDGIPGRWGTKLDFISCKPFDDPHWPAAFGAEPKRTCVVGR